MIDSWSKFDEENGTVSCAGCGDVLGYFSQAHGPAAIYCLNCGNPAEDEETK